MANPEKLKARLLATFLEELDEALAEVNQATLALEGGGDEAARVEGVRTLFRHAHGLKGASRAVELRLVESACHRLEELLSRVRDGKEPLSPKHLDLVFSWADTLAAVGADLRAGGPGADKAVLDLLERLTSFSSRDADAASSRERPAGTYSGASAARDAAFAAMERDLRPELVANVAPVNPAPEPASPRTLEAAPVRLSAERLDRILTQSAELRIARRRLLLRTDELANVRDSVRRWRREWRTIERPLKRLARPRHEGGAASARTARVLKEARQQIQQLEHELERLAAALAADQRLVDQMADPLDDEIKRLRMLPFSESCEGLDRMVRDLARTLGREVDFRVEGGDVVLDRSVLQGLKDPLRHLVRNAIDHGLETPAERTAAGKPPRGRLTVAASLKSGAVEIQVADDGRGLDAGAVRRKAESKGLPLPPNERDLLSLIFLPGFSTRDVATEVSGRGVGLDVVRSQMDALRGGIAVASEKGKGTSFTLNVPLTLTTVRALLVREGGQVYAIPTSAVERLIRRPAGELLSVEGRRMLRDRGELVPVTTLARELGRPEDATAGFPCLVLLAAENRRLAVAVPELLVEQEIVVKPVGARLRGLSLLAGATILASGAVGIVVNPISLVRRSSGAPSASTAAFAAPVPEGGGRTRLLLVDDSPTLRELCRGMLEESGFGVETAHDGEAAWQRLQVEDFDIVVTDVEMPRLDGLGLLARIRSSPRLGALPVVFFTSRDKPADREAGLRAGADEYLVKSGFDQPGFLAAISRVRAP